MIQECKKHIAVLSVFLAFLFSCTTVSALEYAFGTEEKNTGCDRLITLLSGYLANDLQLQKYSLAVRQAELSLKTSSVENGYSLSLATGTMTYTTDASGAILSVLPSASFSLPQADNLAVSITSDVAYSSSGITAEDTALSVSADIISGTAVSRKVTLLKAQRTLLEARRDLQNRAVSAEKEFYTALENLYTTACTVLSKEKDLYDAEIDFQTVKAEGYDERSSTYRTDELEVLSYRRQMEENQRLLESSTRVFASKCGAVYKKAEAGQTSDPSSGVYTEAQDFLPLSILNADALDAASFDPDTYTETESAVWDHYINGLNRSSDVSFTLAGSAGYTVDNTDTNSDSADIGATLVWNGLTVKSGVAVPVGSRAFTGSSSPSYSLSVSFDPSDFTLQKITAEQYILAARQEEIEISSARNDYETSLLDQKTSLGDIQWSKQSNLEEYKLYSELEADMAKWFKSGVITESEYRETQVNKENYRLQCLINDIQLLIYNDETKLLFCRDGELSRELKEQK